MKTWGQRSFGTLGATGITDEAKRVASLRPSPQFDSQKI